MSHDPDPNQETSSPDAATPDAATPPRKEAWPVLAPVDGMPRWLAWLLLLALLGSAIAATRFVLTPPPPPGLEAAPAEGVSSP